MSKQHIKQHIIPETYLKHFSVNEDGNNICVINIEDKYRKGIQIRNSGDNIFWEKKFYNSTQFSHPTALEEMFGESIESSYNELILITKTDQNIIAEDIKWKLATWIFASIQRAPQQRFLFRKILDFKLWMKKVQPQLDYPTGENVDLDMIAKEQHLKQFADEESLKSSWDKFIGFVGIRRWEIIKCPVGCFWITTDNPGFLISSSEAGVRAKASWDYSNSDGLFYPLSMEYGVLVSYGVEDSSTLNLMNSPITRSNAPHHIHRLFNRFSFVTMHRLLISPNEASFTELGEELNKSSTS